MLKQGGQRFDKWKQEGVLEDSRILFNRYNDAETYDMMAILNFGKYSDVEKWAAIEAESPGGLSEEALAFITPQNTYSHGRDLARLSCVRSSSRKYSIFPYALGLLSS